MRTHYPAGLTATILLLYLVSFNPDHPLRSYISLIVAYSTINFIFFLYGRKKNNSTLNFYLIFSSVHLFEINSLFYLFYHLFKADEQYLMVGLFTKSLANLLLLILIYRLLQTNLYHLNFYRLGINILCLSIILSICFVHLTNLFPLYGFTFLLLPVFTFFVLLFLIYLLPPLKNNRVQYLSLTIAYLSLLGMEFVELCHLSNNYHLLVGIHPFLVLLTITLIFFSHHYYPSHYGYRLSTKIPEQKIEAFIQFLPKTRLIILLPIILYQIGQFPFNLFIGLSLLFLSTQIIDYMLINTPLSQSTKSKNTLFQAIESQLQVKIDQLVTDNQSLTVKNTTDPLTGLYNRSYLMQLLDTYIEENRSPFSLLYVTIHDYETILNLYNHQVSSQLLKQIITRLKTNNAFLNMIIRISQSDYLLLLSEDSYPILKKYCLELTHAFHQPFAIDSYVFNLDLVIGIAIYPKDTINKDLLFRYAELAMFEARQSHHELKYAFYSPQFSQQLQRRSLIEKGLQQNQYEQQFKIFYQPQFNLASSKLSGMEALIRWHHPELGDLSPAEFIPLAEETRTIAKLNEWIFTKSISQIDNWNRRFNQQLTLNINTSPLTFDYASFFSHLRHLLSDLSLNPQCIEFDIVEHQATLSLNPIENTFKSLSDMGFRLAIKEFGIGYSSLSYLKQFNIDHLKVAQPLIKNITSNHQQALIIKTIIDMSHTLDIKVIAEGIETSSQLALLQELGCDFGQGYYLGHPVTAQIFEQHHLMPPFISQ